MKMKIKMNKKAQGGHDFPKLIVTFILISLFAFLLIGFATQLSSNYDKNTTDIEEKLGASAISEHISSTKDTAESWKQSFQKQNIFSSIAGIIVTGIFNLANTISLAVTTPFRIFGNILTNVIGVPVVVVNIISALIVLTIIFGIWRLIKIGY